MALCQVNSKQTIFRRIFDGIILLLAIGLIGVFFARVQTANRGFFCDDESIRYPAVAVETVPSYSLIVFVVGTPVIVILLTEALNGKFRRTRTVSKSLLEFCRLVLFLLFALAVTFIIVFISKTTIGYPRPNFIAHCKPDWSKINCSQRVPMFISDVVCTNKNLSRFQSVNIRQSFMSGHAASAASSAVFIVLYGEQTWLFPFSRLLKPLIQVSFLCVAFFIGLTRVTDHVHHWSDVLAGLTTGALVSIWLMFSAVYSKKVVREVNANTGPPRPEEMLLSPRENASGKIV